MSVTNELQQSILDTVQLMSTKAANSTNATLTVKCTIVDVVDAGLGLYKVKYGDNTFEVYCHLNSTFVKDDLVYVLIPDGDFSNEKLIVGSGAPKASMIIPDEESEIIVVNPDNLINVSDTINLKTWENKTLGTNDPVDHSLRDIVDFSKLKTQFKHYLEDGIRDFSFNVMLKTDIDINHQMKGNYGIILTLPFLEQSITGEGKVQETWRDFTMDVHTIPGNPYAYNNFQKVNLYFHIEDTLTYDDSRDPILTVFTQDFGYIAVPAKDHDIEFKDLGVNVLDVLTQEEREGYSLTIVSDTGNYFMASEIEAKSKRLTPILKIKGKNSNLNNWECYWFVEDTSVDINNDRYLSIGGIGWKCLNEKKNVNYDEEGNKTFQYSTNDYTYIVKRDDIALSLRYKCVLVQNETVVNSIIKITKLNDDIDLQLMSSTGSTSFVAEVGYVTLLAKVKYIGVTDHIDTTTSTIYPKWQRFDKNGNYLDNDFFVYRKYSKASFTDRNYIEFEISYPCTKLDELNTINCTFYKRDAIKDDETGEVLEIQEVNLGTRSITVTAISGLVYGLTIQSKDVLYKYDANGNSPLVANYDGQLSSRNITIDPISYKMFKADGTELTDTEYLYCQYKWSFPKNSMMKLQKIDTQALEQDDDYYYISGRGPSSLNYDIADTYNKKKSNNTVILQVTFDGVETSDTYSPRFLKDGEGGTNGTKYAGIITYTPHVPSPEVPRSYGYGERDVHGKMQKLQLIYVKDVGWRIFNLKYKENLDPVLVDFSAEGYEKYIPQLHIDVYKDGVLVNEQDNLYSVSWSIFDSIVTNPCFSIDNDGKISVKKEWTDPSDIYCNTIEAKVNILETSKTQPEIFYAYYPIEITWLQEFKIEEDSEVLIPNLDGGYEEVIYAPDGTNPQYDNTNDFDCIDNLYDKVENGYLTYNWSSSNKLKISSIQDEDESKRSIKPVTIFNDGDSKNYVQVILTLTEEERNKLNTKIQEIKDDLTIAKNREKFYNRIYNDEETGGYLQAFLKEFNYDDYINLLSQSKNILNNRYNLLNYINEAKEALEDIYLYCHPEPGDSSKDKIVDSIFNSSNLYNTNLNRLNNEYKDVYLLGVSKTLDSIDSLENCKIVLTDAADASIISSYGAGVASQLKSLIQTYNLIINKYIDESGKIKAKVGNDYVLQSEYNNLNQVDTNLKNLVNSSNLRHLTEEMEHLPPLQEFINLKDQLTAIISKINNTEEEIINYSAFVNLLNQISDLLLIYNDVEYQKTYYDQKEEECGENIEFLQNELESYNAMLLPEATDAIVHIKPIIMLFNRYSMTELNGWDGNKLYIDENNEQYILAPKIGAGKKNQDNTFTGVTMGVEQFQGGLAETRNQRIGLFGYSNGIHSFFLNSEDGSAIFGTPGAGQIVIDPNAGTSKDNAHALIYSGNFYINKDQDGKPTSYSRTNEAEKGMLINLSLPEIRFGNGNFSVDEEGNLRAAGQGWIGGWKINDTEIYSDITPRNGRITMDSGMTLVVDENNNPILDDKGHKQYKNGNGGKIYSHNHNILNDLTEGFYLSKDGLSIGNTIRITADDKNNQGIVEVGRLSSGKHWTITGNGMQSYISYDTIKFGVSGLTEQSSSATFDGDTAEGQIYLGTDGIRLGNKFAVASNGVVSAKYLIADNGGYIAGWEISPSDLSASGITISSSGSIEANNWSIKGDGSAKFTHVEITSGGGGDSSGSWSSIGGIRIGQSGTLQSANFAPGAAGIGFRIQQTGAAEFNSLDVRGNGSIGGCTISNGNLMVTNAHIESIKAGKIETDQINGKEVGWKTFTALAGFNASQVYEVRLANGGTASIRNYENPQLNQILALANVESSSSGTNNEGNS